MANKNSQLQTYLIVARTLDNATKKDEFFDKESLHVYCIASGLNNRKCIDEIFATKNLEIRKYYESQWLINL